MLNLKMCACVLWQENASTPTQSRKRMGGRWVEKCEQERSGNGRGQDIFLAFSSYLFKLFREHFKSVRMDLAHKGPIQVRPKCLSFRARWPLEPLPSRRSCRSERQCEERPSFITWYPNEILYLQVTNGDEKHGCDTVAGSKHVRT